MGRSRGLEPPTSGTTNRRSNQLSYDRHMPDTHAVMRAVRPVCFVVNPLAARGRASCTENKKSKAKTASKGILRMKISRLDQPHWVLIVPCMMQPGESSPEILRLNKGIRQVPTPRAQMFTLPDFLPQEICADLIRLIDRNRRPSTLADANGDDAFRTSETCDLPASDTAVQELERRLFALNQIDPAHGEPVQGQRYEPGQQFKAHTDYFEPNGADYQKYCSVAGQRSWTFMVYLNDVEAGGTTRFKVLKKMFQPEQGRLVCWNNRRPDGSCNPATLHHAMKVRQGVKYVITKWYRERPWG